MTAVTLSRVHFPVTTLGPGRRVGLWFQGCSIRCPGCISVDTWDAGLNATSLDEVKDRLSAWAEQADGLTVSGGEPFDQSEALAELLAYWRVLSPTSILVFTGYERAHVAPWLARHPHAIDALVTGPYVRDLPQTRALRGSDNQRLEILTPLGAVFEGYERARTPDDRRLDVMFDTDGGAWFAGIPEPGDFQRFRRALEQAGHGTRMSSDVPASAREMTAS